MSLSSVVLLWKSSFKTWCVRETKAWSRCVGNFGDLCTPHSSEKQLPPRCPSTSIHISVFCLPPSVIQPRILFRGPYVSELLCLFLIQINFCFPWGHCFPDILDKEVSQCYFSNSFKAYLTNLLINLSNIHWLSAHHLLITKLGIRYTRALSRLDHRLKRHWITPKLE